MPQDQHRENRFVRAGAVEMHMDISEEPFDARSDRKNAAPQARDNRFVRTRAVEMYMDISEKPFYARIYQENDSDAGRMEHPDQTSAFTLTVNCKNPLVWKHCLGRKLPGIKMMNEAHVNLWYCNPRPTNYIAKFDISCQHIVFSAVSQDSYIQSQINFEMLHMNL